MCKFFFIISKQYILVFLITILLFNFYTISYSKQNNFFVENIQVSREVDLNFKRENVINEIFRIAFETLISNNLFCLRFKL